MENTNLHHSSRLMGSSLNASLMSALQVNAPGKKEHNFLIASLIYLIYNNYKANYFPYF